MSENSDDALPGYGKMDCDLANSATRGPSPVTGGAVPRPSPYRRPVRLPAMVLRSALWMRILSGELTKLPFDSGSGKTLLGQVAQEPLMLPLRLLTSWSRAGNALTQLEGAVNSSLLFLTLHQ